MENRRLRQMIADRAYCVCTEKDVNPVRRKRKKNITPPKIKRIYINDTIPRRMFIQKRTTGTMEIIKPVDYYYYYFCTFTATRPALRVASAAGVV
ncbi:hypothetical protein QTP88_007083 [Uroleucon formosanum]